MHSQSLGVGASSGGCHEASIEQRESARNALRIEARNAISPAAFPASAHRAKQAGEHHSFDTDLIGPMGFYNDISRSWVIGERRPTSVQAMLLDISSAQIAHNIDLLRPGMSFVEFASKAYRLPDAYLSNRYADLVHGCGLGVEYPFVLYPEDADDGMYDGRFEANMIVCVESYVGALDGPEGVKLEQPVLITDDGPEVLSELPLDASEF